MEELLLELIKKQKDYLRFLGNDYDKIATFASVHGYRWDDKLIAKGIQFRRDIKDLNNEIKDSK